MTFPSFSVGEVLRAQDMNAVGMWQVGTMTFSGSTSQTVDGCFTSDYRRYMFAWDFTNAGTTSDNLFMQFRKGGVNAATNYNNTWIYTLRTSASPLTAYDGAGIQMTIGYVGNFVASGFGYISRPAISGPTGVSWQGGGNGTVQGIIASGQGSHTTSDTYDGLRILSASSLTGQVKIYGLRD